MGGETSAGVFDLGLYEAFFNSSADLFCLASFDGRILKASPAWGTALGYAPETLVGRPLLDIVLPDDRAAAGKMLEELRGGGTAEHEARCLGTDGAVKWLRCRCCADPARKVFHISASDITARKTAEEALAASEGTLLRILDAAPMAIAIHDRSGKVDYANARFTRVFGYTLADIPDKDRWAERAAPDPAYRAELLERWTAAIRRAAAGNGEIDGSEYRITCKDGSVKTVYIFGVLTGGKAFVMFDDITDRAEAEARLRESEATLRKILELAPMSMAIVNLSGRIEYINRKAVETFGYVHSDIPDMDSWWAKAYPDEAYRNEVVGRWMGRVRAAFEKKTEIEGGEYRVTCKDRSVKTCYIFGVVAADKVFVMFDDITARVNTERALRESEAALRRVLDNAPIAMGILSADGRIEYLNRKFTQAIGYTTADIRTYEDWIRLAGIDDEHRRESADRWVKAAARAGGGTGEIDAGEFRTRCKDGSLKVFYVRAVTIENRTIIMFDDVTARVKAEEALRRSEQSLRSVVEMAPVAIGLRELDTGELDYVNEAFTKTFGYEKADILTFGDWMRKAMPNGPRVGEWENSWENFRRAMEGNTGVFPAGEYEITCKDGTVKTAILRGVITPERRVLGIFEDVTARTQTLRNLRESEEALRRILEQAPIAIGIRRPNGELDFINAKFRQTFGYSEDEIRTLADWARLAYPDPEYRRTSGEQWARRLQEARRTGSEIAGGEFRITRKDGAVRTIRIQGMITKDGNTLCIFDDITERVKAEESLRENERNLRRILEQTPMSIAIQSLDGRIEFVNSKFTQTFGYRHEEIPDLRAWTERAYPEKAYRDKLLAHWAALIEKSVSTGGEMPGGEYRVTCRDGSVKTVYIFGVVTKDGKVICLLDDVTGRAEMEKALRESESRYRALVETTRTGYVIINREGRVLDANTEYVRLTGRRDLKEVLGRSVLEWTAPHEKERNAAAVAQCARDGYIWDFEIDYITPEGRLMPIEINASVVTREGVPQIATLCRDISSRRKAQEEIQGLNQNLEERVEERTAELTAANEELVSEISQRMKAERAKDALQAQLLQAQKLEAVGRLAGGIAHDFNNILVSISGYAELLRDTMPQGSPARGDLSEILLETERGAALTKQLLTFSAKQEIKLQSVDLNEAAASSEKMLRRIIGSNIHLRTELAGDLRKVLADPSQVSQVMINLVINARDAMPNGGSIALVTRNARLAEGGVPAMRLAPPPGDYAELSVTDNGSGMGPETLDHIFEPFFTTKKPGQGTGLGLSTIYGIVSGMKGGIAVESEPGKGTTFRIYFPVSGS